MCENLIVNFNSLKINIFKELDQFEGKIIYLNNLLKFKTEYQKECLEYINEITDDTDTNEILEVNVDYTPKFTGYVYALKSPHTDKMYIGSTFKDINKRLRQHIYSGKTTSAQIIACGEPYVELLEEFKCDSRIELCRREGHHIKQNKDKCVNHQIAGSTLKESQSRYKDKHAEWYKQYMKEWRSKNQDKIKQYNKNKKKI
jgi:hypothetical protein